MKVGSTGKVMSITQYYGLSCELGNRQTILPFILVSFRFSSIKPLYYIFCEEQVLLLSPTQHLWKSLHWCWTNRCLLKRDLDETIVEWAVISCFLLCAHWFSSSLTEHRCGWGTRLAARIEDNSKRITSGFSACLRAGRMTIESGYIYQGPRQEPWI